MNFRAFAKAVGANVRRARWAAEMTQEELASKALTFRLLSQLERGLGNPTLETLHLLAAALRVRVAELVDVPGDEAKGEPLATRKLKPPRRGPKPKKKTARRPIPS